MATNEGLSRTLLGGHQTYFDYPCTLCEKQEKHVEATRYCEDCFVFLCDVCLTSIHNMFPVNTGHKLLCQEKFSSVNEIDTYNMATNEGLSRTLLGGHQTYFDYPCTLCEKQEKHVEATRYCKDCFVFLCDVCLTSIHNMFPVNTGHKLLCQEKFSSVGQSVVKSFPSKRCSKHPGEFINIYCGKHDVVCCSVCKTLDHGNCKDSQYLPEAAKDVYTSKEYHSTKELTKAFITDVTSVLAERTAAISQVAIEKHHVKQTITDFRKTVDTIFDNLKQRSLNELDKIEKSAISTLEDDRIFLDVVKKECEELLQQLDAFKGDSECELFYLVKTCKQFIQESMKRVNDISSAVQRLIVFNIDNSIENNLRSFVTLGSFEDIHITKPCYASACLSEDSNSVETTVLQSASALQDTNVNAIQTSSKPFFSNDTVSFVKYKAWLLGEFGVSEKSDTKVCNITDICCLEDGSTLITDLNNMKLKRLDQFYKLVDSLQLTGEPASVCAVGPDKVAVSLWENKKVQFVSVEGQLSVAGSFRTRNYCRGMVYIEDKIYVCSGDKHLSSFGSIEVYNNAGKLQYSLPRAAHALPAVPKRVAVTDDGKHLLVTSVRTDNISVLDLAGNLVNSLSNKDVKTPTGICTDGRGQVFVCGINSNTVAQLSQKCQKIEMTLTQKDGVLNPQGVSFDTKTSRLLVSCYRSNRLLVISCFNDSEH